MAFCFGTSTRPDESGRNAAEERNDNESGKQESRKKSTKRPHTARPGFQSRKTGKETFQRLQPAGPGYQMKKRINLFNLPAFLLS
jgi:hypothetical protein